MNKIKYIKTSNFDMSGRIGIKKILRSAIAGIFVVLALLVICSGIFTYSDLDIKYFQITTKAVFFISAFIVGLLSSLGAKSNGWLIGAIASGIYTLAIVVLKILILPNSALGISVLLKIFFAVICGISGGIFGINVKVKKSK